MSVYCMVPFFFYARLPILLSLSLFCQFHSCCNCAVTPSYKWVALLSTWFLPPQLATPGSQPNVNRISVSLTTTVLIISRLYFIIMDSHTLYSIHYLSHDFYYSQELNHRHRRPCRFPRKTTTPFLWFRIRDFFKLSLALLSSPEKKKIKTGNRCSDPWKRNIFDLIQLFRQQHAAQRPQSSCTTKCRWRGCKRGCRKNPIIKIPRNFSNDDDDVQVWKKRRLVSLKVYLSGQMK